MNLKRLLEDGGKEDFKLPANSFKRPYLFPTIFRGEGGERALQQFVLGLEPNIRKWVHEEVDNSFQRLSASHNRIEHSGCRTWQLLFQSDIAHTIFTGTRVLTEDRNPVKVILYDSCTQEILTSGPTSSSKVSIVVLDSEFNPDDHDDWGEQKFHHKTVQNREGKRPLVTGELIVQLHEGVGYIGDVSFTDNSSWIRSGKFRLGVKALAASDKKRTREGISNAFKVKDHRGEAYQKHHPPSLNDEVWRLEKIAKDGASHKKLTELGIHTVGEFLRAHSSNKLSVQELLPNMSSRIRDMILGHALTCRLDDKFYLYLTTQGTGLLFDSIYKLVGATFDGQNYLSFDKFFSYQMRIIENLKPEAYENINDWVLISDSSVIGCPIQMLLASANLSDTLFDVEQDQLEMQTNVDYASPTISFSQTYKGKEQDICSFEMCTGESSYQMHGFYPEQQNHFGMSDSFCNGNLVSTSEDNFMASPLLTDEIPADEDYRVIASTWQGSGLLLGSNKHSSVAKSADSGIFISRNRTAMIRWCKIRAVIKLAILVRHAAKKRDSRTLPCK